MDSFEVRLDGLNLNREVLDLNVHYVGIGDEGCAFRFIKIFTSTDTYDFIDQARIKGKKVKIIVPFIPENHIEEVKGIVRKLLAKDRELYFVVNDLGILNYLNRCDSNLKICLGRFIVNSFDVIPWKDTILKNENDLVKQTFRQINMAHPLKLDFFKRKQVNGLEVNMSAGVVESLKDIRQNDVKINIYYDYNVLAFTRACPVRRFFDSSEESCALKCTEGINLCLDKLWGPNGFFELSDEITFPDLTVRGNKILSEHHLTNEEIDSVDCLIFDVSNHADYSSFKKHLDSVLAK